MSESAEQKEIVRWFRETWPEYSKSLRVSLAGLNFGSGQRGSIMKNHVRSLGVEDSEADILIALKRGEFGALVLEHKKAGAKRGATDGQLEYVGYHNAVGNCACVTVGVDMAKAAIKQYMEL